MALGLVLQKLGDLDRAIACLEEARAWSEGKLGSHHLQVAEVCSNLGLAYLHRGRRAQARSYMARALTLYEGILGAGHPETRFIRAKMLSLED
jgi:tetratricopeptide (TPR) repeat protein